MLTTAQCQALAKEYQALAKEYKDLAQEPDIPTDRAAQLNKIVRSFKGLATEFDMLAANMRDGKRSLQCARSERPPRSTG